MIVRVQGVYPSDRCRQGEKVLKETDRLTWLNWRIDGLLNQVAYGLCSRKRRAELDSLLKEREALIVN